jgi:hypothetical protein
MFSGPILSAIKFGKNTPRSRTQHKNWHEIEGDRGGDSSLCGVRTDVKNRSIQSKEAGEQG